MPLLCFRYGGKWWEMVGNGGKWWENGGKMVGILPKHTKQIFGGSSMEHVRVKRRGGLDHGTLMCIY